MGISDFDRKKSRRMPGVCSFNEDEVLVFHDARLKARLKHVVHFTSVECKAKYKRHAPSHEGTKTSKSKTCPNENKPSWITYMQSSEVIFSWGWRNRTRSITEDNVELKAVYHDFKSIGGKPKHTLQEIFMLTYKRSWIVTISARWLQRKRWTRGRSRCLHQSRRVGVHAQTK